jgi:hypothetical protein
LLLLLLVQPLIASEALMEAKEDAHENLFEPVLVRDPSLAYEKLLGLAQKCFVLASQEMGYRISCSYLLLSWVFLSSISGL